MLIIFVVLLIISPEARLLDFSMVSELREFDRSVLVYHNIYYQWFVFCSLAWNQFCRL